MSKILFQKNRMLLRIRLLKKVSSLELKQQLLDYLNNSVKTRTTFNNAEMNYDLGMQEICVHKSKPLGRK